MKKSLVLFLHPFLLFTLLLSARCPPAHAQTTALHESTNEETAPHPPFPFTPGHFERAWQEAGTRKTLLGLGVGLAAGLCALPLDDEISDRFYEQKPLGPDAHRIGREMGHRKYVALMSVGLTASGQLIGNRKVRDTGILYLESNLITAGFTTLLKKGVGRVRPDGSNRHSFPSGHASSAMASARVLQMRFGWWVGAPAYAAAGYVGLSRVQGKKHYLSDVFFGWALGYTMSSILVKAYRPRPGESDPASSSVAWLPPPEPSDFGLPVLRVRF